ncbi:hypothetical protein JVT61DRAFT_15599 [Boletus reticuloceps]|uniref:Uncharacterized protein n=1 Tax=Boletus reticuloceps TaxID=495285 RepID=A0A8I2YC79_9AGAM|nr:hypothetical protein JVT61DRAFT_15599 [Boletus reticuloceps]
MNQHLPRELVNTTERSKYLRSNHYPPSTSSYETHRIKCDVRQYFRYVMLLHTTSHRSSFLRRTFHLRPTTSCKCSAKLFTTLKLPLRALGGCGGDAYVVRAIRLDGRISGVQTSSRCGEVLKGIWNTRAWPLQEYTAAKVVNFYTEDYTHCLDLKLPNHKDWPEVFLQMEEADSIGCRRS